MLGFEFEATPRMLFVACTVMLLAQFVELLFGFRCLVLKCGDPLLGISQLLRECGPLFDEASVFVSYLFPAPGVGESLGEGGHVTTGRDLVLDGCGEFRVSGPPFVLAW